MIDAETLAGVGDVLRSAQIAGGPWVESFERALCAFCAGGRARALTEGRALKDATEAKRVELRRFHGNATHQRR